MERVIEAAKKACCHDFITALPDGYETVRNADQILVVDKGRIVQQGKHDELMREDGIYKRFVNSRETTASRKL